MICIGLATGLHPDFGAGLHNGTKIGIPFVVVAGAQAKVTMNWTACGSESDAGPYPVAPGAPVEGAPDTSGDRYVRVIDRDNNRLYELCRACVNADGSWNADCGAVFSAETRALLTAMKAHGMIVADNGSNWYLSGSPDERWNNDKRVSEFAQVKGGNFEVVRMDGLVTG